VNRYTIFISVILGVLCSLALGQAEVQVRAQIQPQDAYLGSALEYTVSIQTVGRHDISKPVIDLPPGLRLVGSSTSFESRQGPVRQPDGTFQLNMVLRRLFKYSLAADQIGTITIDPATVVVDGKIYTADPVTVSVLEPQPIDGFDLQARVSKTRVYVGEPFTLYLTWFVGADVREFGLIGAELPDFVEVEPISPAAAARDRSGRYPATGIYGQRIYGTRGQATINGRDVLTVSFQIQYRSTLPGTLDLGPISMIYDAIEGRRVKRGVAHTDSIPVKILPLPQQGRPAGFSGLIGAYSVSSWAQPDEVNVGDPITLTVSVTGPDSRLVEDGPDLGAQQAFAEHFKFDPAGWERLQGTQTEAIFKTTIRALDTEITEIPPVEVPYFDSDEGAYRVARSEAIPITVRPSRVVTLADAVISSSLVPPSAREELGTPKAGIWAIDPVNVLAAPPRAQALESVWWLGLLLVAPPGIWLMLMVRDRVRARRLDAAFERKRAYRRALSLARKGRGQDAVRVYMAGLLGQVPDAVTAADCRRVIADEDLAATVCDWLEADEAVRFGHGGASEPSPGAVESALKRLHGIRMSGQGYTDRPERRVAGAVVVVLACMFVAVQQVHAEAALSVPEPEQSAAATSPPTIENASELYDRALVWAKDDPIKARSLFAEAAAAFDAIERQESVNAAFYRAQGNAHFFAGETGKAVLAYRRGLEIRPADKRLEDALRAARASVSSVESPSTRTTIVDVLTRWRRYLPDSAVAGLLAAAWIVLWSSLIRARLERRRPGLLIVSTTATVSLVAGVALGATWWQWNDPSPVVLIADADARNGPSSTIYDPTFESPLSEGVEGRAHETRLGWVLLELPSGAETWVPQDTVTPVRPGMTQ
jgi:BatD DUF11 like domain